MSTTDYIVVGAGSSGAVVAARLSEDPNVTVTLIEAGKRERHPMLAMPVAFPVVMNNPRFNWNYEGEPEPFAEGRFVGEEQPLSPTALLSVTFRLLTLKRVAKIEAGRGIDRRTATAAVAI